MDSQTRRELQDLLSALLDGALGPDRQARLGELLWLHAEARQLYLAYFELHAELALRGNAGDLSPLQIADCRLQIEKTPERPAMASANRRKGWLARGALGLCGLAAAALLVLVSWPRPHVGPGPAAEGAEASDDTVAVLLRAPGAEWEGAGLAPRAGAALPPGSLRLRSGLAHIQFYSGATVVLEAPAELRLISRTEAYCARGKLRATVPPHARGFTVRTPKLELVDRGTEFGLYVGEEARTEVHVFQGQVDLYDADSSRAASTRRELATGQGVRLGRDGVRLIPSTPAAFQTARYVEALAEEETRRRHEAWEAASAALRRDPTLLVYYPFQPEPARGHTLRDRAGGGRQDGTIVGCAWTAGRWPGKQGLELKRVSDRVRLHVPGTFESITLFAWTRVDALPNLNNSLFMTDGWDPGGLHWQIGRAGNLVLGVKAPPGTPDGHYHAPGVLRPERFGQWAQLAVVYDGAEGRVTHYADGRPAASSAVRGVVPLKVGNAEVGNWNIAARRERQPIRNLSGCVDEFMLFSRALTGEEIQRLYDQGKRWGMAP